jgi:Tol biopolymer transport system component
VFGVIALVWFLTTRFYGGEDEDPESIPALTTTSPPASTSPLPPPDTQQPTSTSTAATDGPTLTTVAPVAQNRSVYTIPSAGGSGTFLTPGSEPVWSPDGANIAFTVPTDDGGTAVYTIPSAGGSGTFLTPGSEPVWSPDGANIAFTVPSE